MLDDRLFSSIRTGMLTQREPRRLIFNNYENNSFNEEDNDSQNKDDSENPSTRSKSNYFMLDMLKILFYRISNWTEKLSKHSELTISFRI